MTRSVTSALGAFSARTTLKRSGCRRSWSCGARQPCPRRRNACRPLEGHVHGVAGGAGLGADDEPLLAHDGVDDGRLAGVGLAQQGQAQAGRFSRPPRPPFPARPRAAAPRFDPPTPRNCSCARRTRPRAGSRNHKIRRRQVPGLAVHLVHHQKRRHLAQVLGHQAVRGVRPLAAVHYQEGQGGAGDGLLGLVPMMSCSSPSGSSATSRPCPRSRRAWPSSGPRRRRRSRITPGRSWVMA